MVDKTNNEPLSLAKAKKQGLRMARLPLDRYLSWGAGSGKSLTLNQMVSIMLEMKKHGDWKKALRFVPRRKINDEVEQENRANLRPYGERKFSGHVRSDAGHYRIREENYQNRQDSSNRNYQGRQDFNNRNYPNRGDFSNRNYQERMNFNDNSSPRRFTYDKSRQYKERKHFEKFKFNLDTWGSTTNRRDES